MKGLGIFGLIFNMILFLFILVFLYMTYHEDGFFLDFANEKALSFTMILLLISSFFPIIFIRQIVAVLMKSGTEVSTNVDLLDQNLDSYISTENVTPPIAGFGIAKFWIVLSGLIQFGLSIFLFLLLWTKINAQGIGGDNLVALFFFLCLFLSSIVSLLYLKK